MTITGGGLVPMYIRTYNLISMHTCTSDLRNGGHPGPALRGAEQLQDRGTELGHLGTRRVILYLGGTGSRSHLCKLTCVIK